MSSKEHDNNCINCQYRHKSSRFVPCVECLANSKPGDQFPGWKEEEAPAS